MSIQSPMMLVTGIQETFTKVITEGEAALFAGLVANKRPRVNTAMGTLNAISDRIQVHPEHLVAIIGGLLTSHLPGEGSRCVTVQYEFLAPVYCDERVETVIELIEVNSVKHLATIKMDCYNQEQKQVITGQAVMLVPAHSLP